MSVIVKILKEISVNWKELIQRACVLMEMIDPPELDLIAQVQALRGPRNLP